MTARESGSRLPKPLDAGIFQPETSSFRLYLAAEGKAAKTARTCTEAVQWFAGEPSRLLVPFPGSGITTGSVAEFSHLAQDRDHAAACRHHGQRLQRRAYGVGVGVERVIDGGGSSRVPGAESQIGIPVPIMAV